MQIVDLDKQREDLFHLCLEDWSDESKEAGPTRALWCRRMKEQGLQAKLALDDNGTPGGMIQYLPIEHSMVEGQGLYFILCIWVHGHKEGRGNFQNRGMGKALLAAAEEDARQRGALGMAAWGLSLPFWMKASWFKKQGYEKVDKDGMAVLMWKPFGSEAKPPSWMKQKRRPEADGSRVKVTCFVNGWCLAQNLAYERAKRAASEFGEAVLFEEIDTSNKEAMRSWGLSDALFIDGVEMNTGPPPSYQKIRKRIEKSVKKKR